MKQRLVEVMKRTKTYSVLRSYFYNTKISDYNSEVLDTVKTNETIKDLIYSEKPFMISRMGSNELSVLKSYKKKSVYTDKQKDRIQSAAGFFPVSESTLDDFCSLYFESIPNIDLLGIWLNPFEENIANEICPKAKLTMLRNLEPYFSSNPWTSALKGKKVLVIHPFTQSIENQYLKRKLLFKDSSILPEFTLVTYPAVQSLGGDSSEYKSWFEALKTMQDQISEIDFDIAIVGAGAYGLPLASYIKNIGKSAIHIGGATQLLFGIYGRRWEENPAFRDLINEYWIRPSESEKPGNANKVENGCYW